jgi:tetratricopeptide (TPR) repeat protein
MGLEARDNPCVAAFRWVERNTYLIDEHSYTEVDFEVIAPRPDVTYRWEFGDGVDNVSGPKVSHIYVTKGSAQVTLRSELDGREAARFTSPIDIQAAREEESDFRTTIGRYAETMRSYPFAKLPTRYFRACMTLFEKVHPDPATLANVIQSYIDTHTPRREAGPNPGQYAFYVMPENRRVPSTAYHGARDSIVGFFVQLARLQERPPVGDFQAAIRTLRRVVDLYPESYPAEWFTHRASALWRIGGIQVQREEFAAARQTFIELEQEALKGLAVWENQGGTAAAASEYRSWIRSGILGQGDVALAEGKLEVLMEMCDRASTVQRQPLRPAVAAARRTILRTNSEDLVRRSWPDDALASIHRWEVEFPKDKLDGTTEFLRGKAWFVARDFDASRRSFHLARKLLDPKDPVFAEMQFLDADALFWAGRRSEANQVFQNLVQAPISPPWHDLARRRLDTIEVLRMDLSDGDEPFLIEHQPYTYWGVTLPLHGVVPDWGGRCRIVSRASVLTIQFPVRPEAKRLILHFRKKGVVLLQVNDQPFWTEPASRADEGMVDQELLVTDPVLWTGGKLRLAFHDGFNYGRYTDPIEVFLDWIELHMLRTE